VLELQEISDRLEIQDLTWRYAELIDSGDFERLRDDVFTDDAFIDYTELGGPAGDLESTIAFLAGAMALFNGYQHLTANHRISIDGDRAMGRIMCFNPMGSGRRRPTSRVTSTSAACGTSTSTVAPIGAGGSPGDTRSSATSTTCRPVGTEPAGAGPPVPELGHRRERGTSRLAKLHSL